MDHRETVAYIVFSYLAFYSFEIDKALIHIN